MEGEVSIIKEHNAHGRNLGVEGSIQEFRTRLTRRAISERISLRDIYDEEAARDPASALLYNYTRAESAMRSSRRRYNPPIPRTLVDLGYLMTDPQWQNRFVAKINDLEEPFLKAIINEEAGQALLFTSTTLLHTVVRDAEELHVDGTFKCVPAAPPSQQLLIIIVVVRNKTIPVAYCLMSNRTRALYEAVFRQFITIVPNLQPRLIMSDFERALTSALRTCFAQTEVIGCYFHYASAVWKMSRSLGHQQNLAANKKKAIKMLMALPLLPADQIVEGMEQIRNWCDQQEIILDNMFRYMERYWIRSIRPENFSVFGLPRRTNNNSEAFNKVLLNKLKIHPNVFMFLEKLIQLNSRAYLDYVQIQNGLRVARPMGSRYFLNDVRIRDAQAGLQNGQHTIFHFLEIAAHSVENLAHDLRQAYDLDLLDNIIDDVPVDEVDPAAALPINLVPNPDPVEEPVAHAHPEIQPMQPVAEPQPPVENLCNVCLGEVITHAFVPCGHLCACEECATIIISGNFDERRCPICRSNSNNIIRIFT